MLNTEIEQLRLEALATAEINDPEKFAPESFGFHEALHTASVVMSMFERHLLEHPAILLDRELYAQASTAFQALFDLYQALGAKHL